MPGTPSVRMMSGLGLGRRLLSGAATVRQVEEVFIVSCARTPLGSMGGSLKSLTAPQLGSAAIRASVEKAEITPDMVQEVYMGCVLQAGMGQAPARQAALGAGLHVNTPATTVNKVCASGLKAMSLAASSLALGNREVVVAGGMESLSNTPYTLRRGVTGYGGIHLLDTCHHDGLTDAGSGWHMGKCAENTATKLDIGRTEQDDLGMESYRRAKKAVEDGVFDEEMVGVTVRQGKEELTVTTDEEVDKCNYNTFRSTSCYWGDTVGVGSSSKLADGGAASVMTNTSGLNRLGLTPLARVVGYGDYAVSPVDWPLAPALGVNQLLDRHGLTSKDISLWEINEAFAVVVLANCRILDINTDRVNIHGGAISLGHPFGMSGARITNHLVLSLRPGQFGVATLCNGGGGAGTIIVQRV